MPVFDSQVLYPRVVRRVMSDENQSNGYRRGSDKDVGILNRSALTHEIRLGPRKTGP